MIKVCSGLGWSDAVRSFGLLPRIRRIRIEITGFGRMKGRGLGAGFDRPADLQNEGDATMLRRLTSYSSVSKPVLSGSHGISYRRFGRRKVVTFATRLGSEGQSERYLAEVRRVFGRHEASIGRLPHAGRAVEAARLDPRVMAEVEEAGRLWAEFVVLLAGVGDSVASGRGRPECSDSTASDAGTLAEGGATDELARWVLGYLLEANLVMVERMLDSPGRLTGAAIGRRPESELPESEAEVLRSVGANFSPLGEGEENPEIAYEASYAGLLATAFTAKEAADRLGGVSDASVRQRLDAGTLYGVKPSREWRLPLFQFTDSGEVPGIKRVLPLIDRRLSPVAVARWFHLPKSELRDEDLAKDLTPREWLLEGRDPAPLLPLAETL